MSTKERKLRVERKTIKLNCLKCGEEYHVEVTERQFEKGKYKKYCCRKCANSRELNDEIKEKISNSCKNSEKVLFANRQPRKNWKPMHKKYERKKHEFVCSYCGLKGEAYNKKVRLHNDCWKKISGGLRKGSSRGKCGWYQGIWCDSSYELAFVIYCLENDIKIERNKKGYNYIYKEEEHIFYPDFRVNNKLTEIKNFRSELTDVKLKAVDEEIDIYYKDTIKPFLNYVIDKYSKDFIKLYENEKPL